MFTNIDLLSGLFIAWCVVTGGFLFLVIYRAALGSREEDQVFLSEGEEFLAREQREIAQKVVKLSPYVWTLGVVSAVLFVVVASLWAYRGWTATP